MLTLNEKIHLNKNGSFTNYINNSRGQHLVNIMHFCVCVCEVFLSWLKSKNIYKRNKKIPSTLLTCIHLATKYNEMNLKEWGNRELIFLHLIYIATWFKLSYRANIYVLLLMRLWPSRLEVGWALHKICSK